jgi:hypothetical protein
VTLSFLMRPVACAVMLGACQFQQSPLARKLGDSADTVQPAAPTLPATDTGVAEAGSAPVQDAQSASNDAHIDATMNDADAATTASKDLPMDPPMTGGLQCEGVFCPFAVEPGQPCCTTQADLARRTARAAGRCGVNLSALPMTTYGDSCWQRDQLGIVDEACPSSAPTSSGTREPGCCADDGQCGTLNADQQLGCRHAPGSSVQVCGQEPAKMCDATGTFGLRFGAEAAWAGFGGVTDDGRGRIEIDLLISIASVDPTTHALQGTGRVCNVKLPPFFSTILCEGFQPTFSESMWESSKLPSFSFTGRYECAAGGCVLGIDPVNYLLGIEQENPVAPWPTASQTAMLSCRSGTGAQCFPDHDGNGQPGVEVRLPVGGSAPGDGFCASGYQFSAAPLSTSIAAVFDGVHRSDRLQLGVRTRVGASLRLTDHCDAAHGSALVENVNSRAIGCLLQPGSYNFPDFRRAGADEVCSAAEAQFIDENLPVYELLAAGATPRRVLDLANRAASQGPDIALVRLGAASAAVSCAQVRAAKY